MSWLHLFQTYQEMFQVLIMIAGVGTFGMIALPLSVCDVIQKLTGRVLSEKWHKWTDVPVVVGAVLTAAAGPSGILLLGISIVRAVATGTLTLY